MGACADKEGAASPDAVAMAKMHQAALDARKGLDRMDPASRQRMKHIIKHYAKPHWAAGGGMRGPRVRRSQSILGVLFDCWRAWHAQCKLWQRRLHSDNNGNRPSPSALGPADDLYTRQMAETIRSQHASLAKTMKRREHEKLQRQCGSAKVTGVGQATHCTLCGSRGVVQCSSCKTAWYCGEHCRERHWDALGHRQECAGGASSEGTQLARTRLRTRKDSGSEGARHDGMADSTRQRDPSHRKPTPDDSGGGSGGGKAPFPAVCALCAVDSAAVPCTRGP